MTDQTPDDVFALYSRFDLDGDAYRVFARDPAPANPPATPVEHPGVLVLEDTPSATVSNPIQQLRVTPIEKPTPLAAEAIEPAQRTVFAPEPAKTVQRATIVPEPAKPLYRTPTPIKTPYQDSSRTALRNLWQHVNVGRERRGAPTAEALAAGSVSVQGAAGGVGTTTIAAVLTRMFARTGRCCAIFNEADDPTLPIFFGAQRVADDHRRFSALYSIFQPRIQVLNRQMFDFAEESDAHELTFISRSFAALHQEFDHLIFDQPVGTTDDSGAELRLYVSVPDLRSLAGMQKFLRKGEYTERDVSAICVLNRFDPASPLHRELLGWYRENFRELVVIHDSSLVPEALAEGTTVLDWAPDTTVSTDFLNLFASVSQLLRSETERLPLCS